MLPVLGDTILLVGHDDGLSVLNMFPKEWSDEGLTERGPNDAVVHHVLSGERSVYSIFPRRLFLTMPAVFTN